MVATLELKVAKSWLCETSHELISTNIIKVYPEWECARSCFSQPRAICNDFLHGNLVLFVDQQAVNKIFNVMANRVFLHIVVWYFRVKVEMKRKEMGQKKKG